MLYSKVTGIITVLTLLAGASAQEHHQHNDQDSEWLQARGEGPGALIDGAKSGFVNARQRIDATVNNFQQAGARPGASLATNFITSLDGQIDNIVGTAGNFLAPLTGGLSNVVLAAALGPTFQSLTDGVEVLLGNIVGGTADIALVPAMHMLSGSLGKVSFIAGEYKMDNFKQQFSKQSQALTQAAILTEAKHRQSQTRKHN